MIGRQLSKRLESLLGLGIRQMRPCFIESANSPLFKHSISVSQRRKLMESQKTLKNSNGQPSGHGDLLFGILFTILNRSSILKGSSQSCLFWSFILGITESILWKNRDEALRSKKEVYRF